MAKVTFTSAVSEIRGKLRGDVFKAYRQGFSLGDKAKPPQSNTPRQAQNRANFVMLLGMYNALPSELKTIWTNYGALLIPPISGQNAYVRINLPILYAIDCGFTLNSTPPPTPDVVLPPMYLKYWKNIDNTHQIFCPPADTEPNAVSVWKAILPGYSALNRERWEYLYTKLYTNPKLFISNPFEYPLSVVFRMRTISPTGKLSVFTPRTQVYPRTLQYFDPCDSFHGAFVGNWYDHSISVDRVEGTGAYYMVFNHAISDSIAFGYEPAYDTDWTDYRYFNFLIKANFPNLTLVNTELRLISAINGDQYPAVFNWQLPYTSWQYITLDFDNPTSIHPSFAWNHIKTIMFNMNAVVEEDLDWEILFDHVHLDHR